MAVKKPVEKPDAYTKEQVLSSKRYGDKKDVVNVILKDGKYYSIEEVDELIANLMKGRVK